MNSVPKQTPGFTSLVDQDRPVRLLTDAMTRGVLPHAFLFTGIDGIGKKTAAMALAMAVNCRERRDVKMFRQPEDIGAGPPDIPVDPCGRCRSCKKSWPETIRMSC